MSYTASVIVLGIFKQIEEDAVKKGLAKSKANFFSVRLYGDYINNNNYVGKSIIETLEHHLKTFYEFYYLLAPPLDLLYELKKFQVCKRRIEWV